MHIHAFMHTLSHTPVFKAVTALQFNGLHLVYSDLNSWGSLTS